MAVCIVPLCTCALLSLLFFIGSIQTLPLEYRDYYDDDYSDDDVTGDSLTHDDVIDNMEVQILSDIEQKLNYIKDKMSDLDELKETRENLDDVKQKRFSADEFYGVRGRRGSEENHIATDKSKRFGADEFYGVRGRRGSWENNVPVDKPKRFSADEFYGVRGRRGYFDENMADGLLEEEKEKELLVKALDYYNELHAQRNTDAFDTLREHRTNKRQPPQGFHAVRGKRPSSFQPYKRPSSSKLPVNRRDPLTGFSAMRGK